MNGIHLSTGVPKGPHKGTLNVLIVDDHEVFRQGLMNLVKGIKGFHVIANVGNMHDALALLASMHVDLVLLDLSLPDSDGVESVHLLKKVASSLAIIIISASMDDDTLLDVVSAGASGYLTKDTYAADIIRALQGFQRGELAMIPAVTTNVVHLLLHQCQSLETELHTYLQADIKAFEAGKPETIPLAHPATPPLFSPEFPPSSLPGERKGHLNTGTPTDLTPQEEKVLQLMHRGYSNKQIATQLFISHFTVGKHVQNILRKLGASNRTQAVSYTSFEGDNLL